MVDEGVIVRGQPAEQQPIERAATKKMDPGMVGSAGAGEMHVHPDRELELVLDYKYDTCFSYKLGRFVELDRPGSGHLAMDLAPAKE